MHVGLVAPVEERVRGRVTANNVYVNYQERREFSHVLHCLHKLRLVLEDVVIIRLQMEDPMNGMKALIECKTVETFGCRSKKSLVTLVPATLAFKLIDLGDF